MPITKYLENNAREYGNEVCLVELNPSMEDTRRVTWREYDLIEPSRTSAYRREITWGVFDEKANRFANLLISRGIGKNDKVAILLMNGLEWLPIYFGILKAGAIAVPLNYRYSSEEIEYCVNLAEADILIFGPEFIGRVDEIVVFNELSSEDYARIAVLMLDELKSALHDKSITLEYAEDVPMALVEKMDGNVRGARDLRNVIRRNAEDKISSYLVEHYGEPIQTVRLTAENGEIMLCVE